MNNHLGYSKYNQSDAQNSRNGYNTKNLRKKIKEQIAEPLTKEDIERINERLEVLEKMYEDSEE
uniref:hypothetical protein n=1 Tax=Rickettsia felis TaxID=42862 RepID=UPI000A9C1864|nr:hypothetical protein [Rickettsia felis]